MTTPMAVPLRRVIVCLSMLAMIGDAPSAAGSHPATPDMGAEAQAVIEEDWRLQEARRGRTVDDPHAVRDAWSAAKKLLDGLSAGMDAPDLAAERKRIVSLSDGLDSLDSQETAARADRYVAIRRVSRAVMLKNPLLAGRPILLMKRRRFICQMLHEYIGYYYNYDGISGGGLYVLDRPGTSMQVRGLLDGILPEGNFATPALSHDGRTVYFAFCRRTSARRDREPTGHYRGFPSAWDVPPSLNYYGAERACFSIYALDLESGQVRQLTDDREDDFNPCPLPDGRVIFMSSRRGGFCRCDNPFEPIPTTTLHSMQADGSDQRPLSFHETNEWHPTLLNDGRLVYCRWDYVDRSAAHFHGLWISNPDGTNPASCSATTPRTSAPVFSRGRFPDRSASPLSPVLITPMSADRWCCSIPPGRDWTRIRARTISGRWK